MNLKKALPLAAALILGLISARMVMQIVRTKSSGAAANGPPMVDVVTASRDVTAGERLDDGTLTVSQFVAGSAPTHAFSSTGDINGRVAVAPIMRGQAVVETLLAPKGSAAGLQAVIPVGMRAVTIEVNEVSSVAGYVTPGSHIDLLQTLHDDVTNQFVDRCLVQDVLVSAVGTRSAAGTSDTEAAHSVTLLVTPKQAQIIDLAGSNGRARMVLRGQSDSRTDDMTPIAMNELVGHRAVEAPVVAVHTADPFAASTGTTQPAVALNQWRVRVISAGDASIVSVHNPLSDSAPTVTGADSRNVGSP